MKLLLRYLQVKIGKKKLKNINNIKFITKMYYLKKIKNK
jgi:hypothetical protein